MAGKAKKNEVVSLETVLWNCRVALRGIGSSEKNRDAVIGLVFLKFAGDKFEKRREEIKAQYGLCPCEELVCVANVNTTNRNTNKSSQISTKNI